MGRLSPFLHHVCIAHTVHLAVVDVLYHSEMPNLDESNCCSSGEESCDDDVELATAEEVIISFGSRWILMVIILFLDGIRTLG